MGVILMVAITVILAAVIGAFVLDLGNNQTAPPRAGLSYEEVNTGDLAGMDSGAEEAEVRITVADPGNIDGEMTVTYNKAAGSPGTGTSTATLSSGAGDTATVTADVGTTIRVTGTNNGQNGLIGSYEVSQ